MIFIVINKKYIVYCSYKQENSWAAVRAVVCLLLLCLSVFFMDARSAYSLSEVNYILPMFFLYFFMAALFSDPG